MTHQNYSFSTLAFSVNGIPMKQGLWIGDDTISIEPNKDVSSTIVGVNGDTITSFTNDKSHLAKVKAMSNSLFHQLMTAIYTGYSNGIYQKIKFLVANVATGEGGISDNCSIQTKPSMVFGENDSMREWALILPNFINSPISPLGD